MKEYTIEEYANMQEKKKARAEELVEVQMKAYGFNMEREQHVFEKAVNRAMNLDNKELEEELKAWGVVK